jgi:hypothetical protein
MNVKLSLPVVLILLLLVASLAYVAGMRKARKQTLAEQYEGQMGVAVRLYDWNEAGLPEKVQSTLGLMVFANSQEYQRLAPASAKTNQTRVYLKALELSKKLSTNFVTLDAAMNSAGLTNVTVTIDHK